MRNKRTAAMKLFGLLYQMSKLMENAGDKDYSNILNHICKEYAGMTIKEEKEQIINAWMNGDSGLSTYSKIIAEKYYNEKYGNANE